MAVIACTKDVPTTVVTNAATNLTVTVTATSLAFSVYAKVFRSSVVVHEWKSLHGANRQFSILAGDTVTITSCGTTNVTVVTV